MNMEFSAHNMQNILAEAGSPKGSLKGSLKMGDKSSFPPVVTHSLSNHGSFYAQEQTFT